MTTEKNRRLGTNEKVFWVLDQKSALHFAIAAEIDGQAPESEWRNALAAVQHRHPNLSASIAGDQYANTYLQQKSDCPIPLQVIELAANVSWNEILEQELTNPIDQKTAPLVRTVLIHQEKKSIFIFVSNHSIGDGISGMLIINDLLLALNGVSLDALEPIPMLDELLGVDNFLLPSTSPGNIAPQNLKPRVPVKVERLQLSEQLTRYLLVRAKLEKTTVHGALSAALLLAGRQLSQSWNNQPVRIMHPVSLRKTFSLEHNYNLLVNFPIIAYDPDADAPFWELARTVKASLTGTTTEEWNRSVVTGSSKIFYAGMDLETVESTLAQAFDHQLLLTNLGVYPYSSEHGKLRLKALYGPLVLAPNPGAQTIGVITVNGRLSLTLTSHDPMPGLLEKTMQVVTDACNSKILEIQHG